MARTNMQTGVVAEDVTVTLDQGGGVSYSINLTKGSPITLIVIDNSPSRGYRQPVAVKPEETPF